MTRINLKVTMNGIYEYKTTFNFHRQTNYIYNMQDDEGKVYVWKTTTYMVLETEVNGHINYSKINKGDQIVITASVKGESEYKGQPQTELTRVKVIDRTFKAETYEERMARIEAEREQKVMDQKNSLKGGDFIWRMPYSQYKEHYADCETVIDSYEEKDIRANKPATIEVIVREGRLKASGVRGERFARYVLEDEKGEKVAYKATCARNAIRRAKKEFNGEWKCVEVYAC